MLEMMKAQKIKYPGRLENKSDLITKLRKIKLISFVDNNLNSLGQRNWVQNYLSQSKLGKNLVTEADLAIQHGFGSFLYVQKIQLGHKKSQKEFSNSKGLLFFNFSFFSLFF